MERNYTVKVLAKKGVKFKIVADNSFFLECVV